MLINKKILFVLLTISALFMSGCSNNNRSSELAQELKKDGYHVDDYSKDEVDFPGSFSLLNYKDSDYDKESKTIEGGIYVTARYSKNSKGLREVIFVVQSIGYYEGNTYCVYSKSGDCFNGGVSNFSKEKQEIEIAAQPKLKKRFNKFLKKYDMTKDEFMDLLQYIYDNDGKLE